MHLFFLRQKLGYSPTIQPNRSRSTQKNFLTKRHTKENSIRMTNDMTGGYTKDLKRIVVEFNKIPNQ